MKVFLMIIAASYAGQTGTTSDVDFVVFKHKETCEKNIPYIKKQLQGVKKYKDIIVECFEKEVNE